MKAPAGEKPAPHLHPSASFSATLRTHLENQPGSFARLAAAIGAAGEPTRSDRPRSCRGGEEGQRRHRARCRRGAYRSNRRRCSRPAGYRGRHVSDRTFLLHLGGKLEVQPKAPLKTRDDLSMAYTPGVARICKAISTRLGLHDQAERCRRGQRRDSRARPRRHQPGGRAPGHGGEGDPFQGIRQRRCVPALPRDHRLGRDRQDRQGPGAPGSEASTSRTSPRRVASKSRRACRRELDIPVFHDDQHGTTVVVLAGLLNALRVVGKRLEECRASSSPGGCRRGLDGAHVAGRRGQPGWCPATAAASSVRGARASPATRRCWRKRPTPIGSRGRPTPPSSARTSTSVFLLQVR